MLIYRGIVLVWYNFDWYIFYDFQAICFESYALYRIVGEQTHFVYTEMKIGRASCRERV